MRLFTALDISAEVRAALVDLLAGLKPAARFRWSRPENLHITTKFIGEWAPGDRDALRRALAAIPPVGPVEIAVRGLSWFPNPHHPRVLFASVEAPGALAELHARTDAACAALGIAAETKPFRPHLTLARIKETEGLAEVRARIAARKSLDFGQFSAIAFHLYESRATPAGSQYVKLEEFSLR